MGDIPRFKRDDERPDPMQNRFGRFSISLCRVHALDPIVRDIMGRVVVVKCELNYATGQFEYIAYSPDFETVAPGYDIPVYTIALRNGRFLAWHRLSR
jgi:hypothetical protein